MYRFHKWKSGSNLIFQHYHPGPRTRRILPTIPQNQGPDLNRASYLYPFTYNLVSAYRVFHSRRTRDDCGRYADEKNDSQHLSTIERRNGESAPGSGMRRWRGEIDKRGCDKKDTRNT
jgi:hypothetical protein